MKQLKLLYVIAIGFAMTSCGVLNDVLEHGGARLIGEYATDGYIHYLEKNGADAESIQQARNFSDVVFNDPKRIDHIQAWQSANTINKIKHVSGEVLTVLSKTEHLRDRAEQLQLFNDMLSGSVDALNALSETKDDAERRRIIARSVFDLSTMRSEYASSNENVNRKFNKLCKKDPSLADEYEVEGVEFDYVKIEDNDTIRDRRGFIVRVDKKVRYEKVATRWGIVRKKSQDINASYVESFITEEDLRERQDSYWESLKPVSNTPTAIESSEEPATTKDASDTVDAIDRELGATNLAIKKINKAYVGQYEFDKTELNEAQKSELSAIAALLNAHPSLSVCLTGHTCNIGTDEINYKKGLKRAEAAKRFLEEQGVSAERISVESAGSTMPSVPNISAENRKLNRRVTFLVK